MEGALMYELEKHIPELAPVVDSDGEMVWRIYPTNAPEIAKKPYLVYARINTDRTKTLEGYGENQALSYMFSIMATRYGEMKALTEKVEAFLMSIPKTSIGEIEKIHIQDVNINNISEAYEHALGVNRGIIDFTIYI